MKKDIQSQYLAALAMLEKAIASCPDALWDNPADKNRFWHVAFHAIFYTHLYIQPVEKDFVAWVKHRENYEFMGPLPWPPHDTPEIGEPYSKADLLEYVTFCHEEIGEKTAVLDFTAAESGFHWIPLNKLELQFYNIRHLQHHTGELCDRLGAAGIDVEWIGIPREDS
ncbi:MAG: DinB family protein [Chloroflexi bacterium]|nr:DinB family protein [Chloroflexota bacterium]